jgi:hypothetical protein
MSPGDVRALAESHAYPRIRDSRGRIVISAGARAWRDYINTASTRDLTKVVDALRQLERSSTKPTKERQPTPAPTQSGPTAAHWRAVGDAIEKFCGLGHWAYRGFRSLPYFEIRWDDPHFPYDIAAGMTALFENLIVVALRSDLSPQEVHRIMLHELQHVADHVLISEGEFYGYISRDWIEERARYTADYLAAL